MTKPKTFSTALFALLLAVRVLALDIYVATNGTGDGSSWAQATNSIAGAVQYLVDWEGGYGGVNISNGVYANVKINDNYFGSLKGISGLPDDVVLDGGGTNRFFESVKQLVSGITFSNSLGLDIFCGQIKDCVIVASSAPVSGGVLQGDGGEAYNCLLVMNEATNESSAIATGLSIYNSTVADNTGKIDSCALINCISSGNTEEDSNLTESYSCGAGYTGTGSITSDPLFVGSGDYRLQAGSPCINAGTNSTWTLTTDTDLDGNKRRWPANGQADMGAYEFGSQPEYLKKVFLMKSN